MTWRHLDMKLELTYHGVQSKEQWAIDYTNVWLVANLDLQRSRPATQEIGLLQC